MTTRTNSIGVVYLAWGGDPEFATHIRRFIDSYQAHPAGMAHRLYVVLAGFRTGPEVLEARLPFTPLDHTLVPDFSGAHGIGTFFSALRQIDDRLICFLDGRSELLGADWLRKLATNLHRPKVGLVGATGSFESLRPTDRAFPRFPNIHLRTTAFMATAASLLAATASFRFSDERECRLFESGPRSLTHQMLDHGLEVLVVGRDGRAYTSQHWPRSGTYCQGTQRNLLVSDPTTRHYAGLSPKEKLAMARQSWGDYLPTTGSVR